MKSLVERVRELLEEKARRLFDPESTREIPSKVPVKAHPEAPEKARE